HGAPLLRFAQVRARRTRLRKRQLQRKGGAAPLPFAEGADRAAVQLGNLLDDRQSQAEAPVAARTGRILLAEALEDTWQEVRRDALTLVAHQHSQPPRH